LNHFQKVEEVGPYYDFRRLMAALRAEHTLSLIQKLRERPLRYFELGEGIKPRTLARRVVALKNLGIIEARKSRKGKRSVVVYGLTPIGIDLLDYIDRYEKERTEKTIGQIEAQKEKHK
jgi:DNA-binding HxlR family transcriptional regulator